MNKHGDKVLGGALIISALLFLGSEAGIVPDFDFGVIVPGIIFVGLGIAGIYQRSFSQATFSFAFAYIFVQESLNIPEIGFIPMMLAATLLSIGISLVFPQKTKRIRTVDGKKIHFEDNTNDISVTFGGIEKYISSTNLDVLNIHALFGDAKVYFEQAAMLTQEATINLSVTCGEVCIFVPRNWKVESSVKCIFGEVSKTGVIEEQIYTLHVTGNVTCGEVQVVYI